MKTILLSAILALGITSQAAVSPVWNSIIQIDAMIAEIAEGRANGLSRQRAEDVSVSNYSIATKAGNITATIGLGYVVCTVKLTAKKMPEGLIGRTDYDAKVKSCMSIRTVAPVATMRYEDVRNALEFYAKKNSTAISDFRVTGTLKNPQIEIGEEAAVVKASGLQCRKSINCMPPVKAALVNYCGAKYKNWAAKNCAVQPLIFH